MARRVCRHADGAIQLVAVTSDVRGTYFDRVSGSVYDLPVTPLGVHVDGVRIRAEEVADIESWVRPRRPEYLWTHPAVRSDPQIMGKSTQIGISSQQNSIPSSKVD